MKKDITYQHGNAEGNHKKINRKETKSMKKTLLIIAALMLATSMVWADAHTGAGPGPITHNVTISVIVPGRLGINIPAGEHTWTLDLATALPTYPPTVMTAYSITGNATIQIISNAAYHYAYTASMTSTLTNLTVGDFQYDAIGWTPSWTGWQSFGASGNFETGLAATGGWVNRNQMYQVNVDGSEATGTGVMTLVHTISQP